MPRNAKRRDGAERQRGLLGNHGRLHDNLTMHDTPPGVNPGGGSVSSAPPPAVAPFLPGYGPVEVSISKRRTADDETHTKTPLNPTQVFETVAEGG